ncbi:MAG: metallophosphoesterase family protein [Clostridiales bacterium]|mgnify:CR=1 FL=1|uniref:metallophosphoesterase family protein n=1 Tax=Clostridium sp. N3C TaxID=1776758 RepID=UPI00092DEDC4|nr:metallophosphoesterase family protein [Clostridium sp. N3C]NLZ48751.1 metallophosphoesterase family protein [Clostridiales bacterium]SCN26607.1 Calcineurin-like phosphoesterase [Clostridium sp. N3C]
MKIKLQITLIFSLLLLILLSPTAISGNNLKPSLAFRKDGTFKIVQFTDLHCGPSLDKPTSRLMKKVIKKEKPDLVILTGDIIDKKCKNRKDIKKTITDIALIMEKRKIPWCIVFGNHDSERGIMSKEEMMNIYMSYSHNLSSHGPNNIGGIGNYNLLIKSSKTNKAVFNIYLLDSGTYAPKEIGGYGCINFSQIQWYRKVSDQLKKEHKKTIPSLMFTHIPLPEFKEMWKEGTTEGNRNKEEHPSKINSGLFASLLEMKDVKGVFVGHDHTNDYVGEYYGIKLGYCPSSGYKGYGLQGYARGARVFLIKEEDPSNFETWIVKD